MYQKQAKNHREEIKNYREKVKNEIDHCEDLDLLDLIRAILAKREQEVR